MQTQSISSAGATQPSTTALPSRIPQKTLGQQDFLKLITVQMTKQDPMKPMEDTAFIAQMAQFTSLEQTNSLVKEFGLMRTGNEFTTASSFIGRQVSVLTPDKKEISGPVTSVETSGSDPLLYINGTAYPLSSVFRVELIPPAKIQPAA